MLSVSSNIAEFERGLSDFARRQLPYATALALNDTAGDLKEEWGKRLSSELKSPTPFTLRGIYTRRASKGRRVSEVGVKDIQAGYLSRLQDGGTRRPKGKAIPIAVGLRVNKYGNMPRGAVAKAASRSNTFVGKVGGQGGIWQRAKGKKKKNAAPKLLVAFRAKAEYSKSLSLTDTAAPRVRAKFPVYFSSRFKQAIATGR